jgi:hypothetical protein
MRRRARPVHLARLRVNDFTGTLMHAPQAKWPRHLQLAGAILEQGLKVPDPTARAILATSVTHALACAQAMDRRALARSRAETKAKVRKSFSRLEKCFARAPARLRNALDDQIYATPKVVDTEAIEAIIDAAYQTFACSKLEPATAALRALSVKRWKGRKIVGLKTEYGALDLPTRHKCEAAVSSLPRAAVSGAAVAVFKALTSAIDESPAPPAGVSTETSDLIIDCVAAVATLWRENELRPTRAYHPENPKYKSKFHRFVELVLTAVSEPGSNRHTADMDEILRRMRAHHARLQAEMRSKIGKGLKREDREWLVSDDHVRKALARRKPLVSPTLKTGQDTP